MLKVGLTGGIGSGKSAVSSRLEALGAVVIDADALAREVVEPGTDGLAEVVAEFGPEVLAPDGSIDRPRLGRIVFADPDRLAALNAVVHPRVGARTEELTDAAPAGAVVVDDVPLLVENGLQPLYDAVVVVDAPEDVRIARLTSTRAMTEDEARARIRAQADRRERLAAADIVIDNSRSLEALTDRVAEVWKDLEHRAAEKRAADDRTTGGD